MKKDLSLYSLCVFALLILVSCVKDTSFDSVDDIVVTPEVDVDLIFFDKQAIDFYDPDILNGGATLRDTTGLQFLNSGDLGNDITRVEFFFKFTNSIPRSFNANFEFLNEDNVPTYTTQTTVSLGTPTVPIVTEFTENVEGDELAQLILSNKVVVTVSISSADQNLEGNLNLQSKAIYYLEF